jgi:hypothetical protein
MKAPQLPNPFRNVRQSPRRFKFRSRHLPSLDAEWQERKQRVESEVLGESAGKRSIKFDRSGAPRSDRRGAMAKASRYTTLRLLVLIVALSWVAVKGLQWVDGQDFGGMIDALKNG